MSNRVSQKLSKGSKSPETVGHSRLCIMGPRDKGVQEEREHAMEQLPQYEDKTDKVSQNLLLMRAWALLSPGSRKAGTEPGSRDSGDRIE